MAIRASDSESREEPETVSTTGGTSGAETGGVEANKGQLDTDVHVEADGSRRSFSIAANSRGIAKRLGKRNGSELAEAEPSDEAQAQSHSDVETLQSAQPPVSTGARDRPLPQDEFLIYDRLTRESTLAQDTLGFDYVRGDGIIVDGDEYIGLVEVHPRNWLVLNDAERMAVFRAYTSFLLGLKYPIQIVALPREFDINTHTEKIRMADTQAKRSAESPILRHGRRRHVAWLHNTIDRLSVKDRDFYLVTRVRSSHVNPDTVVDSPFARVPLIGDVAASLTPKAPALRASRRRDIDARNEERCIQEVRARQNELSETLTKTGVRTRIVSDRDETMDVLYRHFNHVESPFLTYNHATYTKLLANALERTAE